MHPHRLIPLIAVLALAGCGGGDEPAEPRAAAPTVAKQKVERFVADFDAAQTERLFGESEDGVDPATLVGEWQMQLNSSLGILEVLAPDGGGPVLDIVEDRGETMLLKERQCPDGFTLQVTRSAEGLTFERESGRCPETLDLLVEEPWRPAS